MSEAATQAPLPPSPPAAGAIEGRRIDLILEHAENIKKERDGVLAPVGHEKAVALELVAVFGLGFGKDEFHPGARNAQALRIEHSQKVAAASLDRKSVV